MTYIYIYILFHQCVLIKESGKIELIFFVALYFCFYFEELENIPPIHFISTEWKKLK